MNIIKLIFVMLSLAGAVGTSLAQDAPPKSCHVSEDKMGRGEIRQCIVRSTNGLSTLVIENRYGSVEAYINLNTMLRNHKALVIRWDDEKAVTTAMSRSSDFHAMFFIGAQSAILKLAKSKTLMVESDTYRRGTSVDTFTISDGEALASFVLKRTNSQSSAVTSIAASPDKLVQDLQIALNQRGFNAGLADGYMGPQTQAAVLAAQRTLGLSANGLASQELLNAMRGITHIDSGSKDAQRAQDRLAGSAPQIPSAGGNFVLQVMVYDSVDDAQRESAKLFASGITSVFIDGSVNANGNSVYRLRIGPFPSRDAAQAVQIRLQTMGYSGTFITSHMAAPAQAPSAKVNGYGTQIRACLQPSLSFSAPPRRESTNPSVVYRVQLRPDGTITEVKLTRSSGNSNFDRAVETGIRRCTPFPRPHSGSYPSYIDINYNMYD